MLQKSLWIIGTVLLAVLGLWLAQVMPSQAWGQWDGASWRVVDTGWAVLWRGWPLLALGALAGAGAASTVLALTLKHLQAVDFKLELARLRHQRDAAVSEADARVSEREREAMRREEAASEAQRAAERARGEALAAHQAAEQAKAEAEQAVRQANFRARNAICAAERIKRRVEGKPRLDSRTSAP
jgi:hypothetical protein